MHNEIQSRIKYLWEIGSVLLGELTSSDSEVSEFVRSGFGLALHIEEDVGLRLPHGVLIGQCHSAVIEVEPAAFVNGIGSIMSRANPRGRGIWVRGNEQPVRP